jgi:riboflavin synthase
MFTGIIEAIGRIDRIESRGKDLTLTINSAGLDLSDVRLGDSIAVNGVCLTVIRLGSQGFAADVSAESLVHTNIAHYQSGTMVNLEKALTLATRLGGHLVSGHVDGIGRVLKRQQDGRSVRFDIACSSELNRYIANKGSITVDGVSLTVTGLLDSGFSLNIVPHTVAETTIESFIAGRSVHVEVDLMARYAERLLEVKSYPQEGGSISGMDKAFLAQNGFLR